VLRPEFIPLLSDAQSHGRVELRGFQGSLWLFGTILNRE
jgi:hypothetical protein